MAGTSPSTPHPDPQDWIVPDAARLEAMAEFAAGAGHEINNPLATIVGRAQQLLKDEKNPQRRQMLQAIGAQAYRIRDMIGDAMLFGRPPRPEVQDIDLAAVIAFAAERFTEFAAAAGCTVSMAVPPGLIVKADRTQLAIVVAELIRNSCQALRPDGGEVRIWAERLNDEFVKIEVGDRGSGFSETERIHAFDPFFSGRQAGRGLGFGLPKCWQIVRQHCGSIEIHSPPRTSTESAETVVEIRWPLAGSRLPSK